MTTIVTTVFVDIFSWVLLHFYPMNRFLYRYVNINLQFSCKTANHQIFRLFLKISKGRLSVDMQIQSVRKPEAAEQRHIKKTNINTPIKTPGVMTIKPEKAAGRRACVCVCECGSGSGGARRERWGAAAKWEEGRRRKERSSVYARPLAITIFLLIIKSRMRVGRRGGEKVGRRGRCHTRATGEKTQT